MKTLEIISIDKFKYTLKDLEKEYILNIEFAGYNPVVHDKIIMHEELLNILYLLSFGPLDSIYGKNIQDKDDQDIIVIIHDDKKIYLKRLYGWFMISLDDFKKVELKVGTIIDASVNKGARKPAYKMRIDFGDDGIKNTSAQITKLYEPSDLIGKQVVAVINFPPLKVSEVKSEVLVLGAETPDGVVLLTTDKLVANGAMVDWPKVKSKLFIINYRYYKNLFKGSIILG